MSASRGDREVERRAVTSADARVDARYVVFAGELPKSSAPSLTLAKALEGLGIEVRFVAVSAIGRLEWIRILRSATAILLVSYDRIDPYVLSQLATAVAMDVPIVRWWVGTDVLNAVARDEIRWNAQRLDAIVAKNVAVAPHLVDELSTIGVRAHFVPSVLDPEMIPDEVVSWSDAPRPVLVYLPGWRKEFFGIEAIEPAIVANRDLRFIVVADETHSLAHHANVESHGWVGDMSEIYARAGCVLRITDHDGLPRMLIEGLLRGMYGIYSWPLDGCWEARTTPEIVHALARYRMMTAPNLEGRAAMLTLLEGRPDEAISGIIADASVPLSRRVHAMSVAVRARVFPAQFK